jgi:hypothetical protein
MTNIERSILLRAFQSDFSASRQGFDLPVSRETPYAVAFITFRRASRRR